MDMDLFNFSEIELPPTVSNLISCLRKPLENNVGVTPCHFGPGASGVALLFTQANDPACDLRLIVTVICVKDQ